MRFAKAHGLGNDFILVAEDLAPADLSPWAVRLCDRHRGIGGDGVVLHAPTPDGVSFRLVNADGLAGEISGNGLRCLAALAVRSGWAPPRHVVRTVVGARRSRSAPVSRGLYRIGPTSDRPGSAAATCRWRSSRRRDRVIDHPLEAAGRTREVTATSMGNPHCAVFLDEPADDALLQSLGPALELHPFFPKRTNVEFVTVVSPSEIRVRFWERGVGYTMASGTGSASAVVASIITGRTGRTREGRLRRRDARGRVARGRLRPADRRGRDPVRRRLAGPLASRPRGNHEDLHGLGAAVLPPARRVRGEGDGVTRHELAFLVPEGQGDAPLDDVCELLVRVGVCVLPALASGSEDGQHRLQLASRGHRAQRFQVRVRPGAVQSFSVRRTDDQGLVARRGGGEELAESDAERVGDLLQRPEGRGHLPVLHLEMKLGEKPVWTAKVRRET